MKKKQSRKIRFAVVGQGYIAQIAVLPAFRHAHNAELTALVSGEPAKLKALGKKYGVRNLYTYDQYDELLASGLIDAVYIAVPNDKHEKYAVRAAQAGIHVLCEKPLAVDAESCLEIIKACELNHVKLMTAYRLHFDPSNLEAIKVAQSGKIGDPRIFNSVFTMPLDQDNYRAGPEDKGGGPVFDIGIYCINAARYLFQDEPIEVSARAVRSGKLKEGPDSYGVTMKFPGERLAQFACSFGAAATSMYEVIGTKGDLCMEDPYEYAAPKHWWLTVGEKTSERTFRKSDQFAPELIYFSDCILQDKTPEPAGYEGMIDVIIIQAILHSARLERPISLSFSPRKQRPGMALKIRKPPIHAPKLVRAKEPSKKAA